LTLANTAGRRGSLQPVEDIPKIAAVEAGARGIGVAVGAFEPQ
jgi:hypothetical protein